MRRAVLVIEKNSLFQEIRPILSLAGYQVLARLKSGMDVLRLLHRYEPDLIITDWSVQGQTVQDLLETMSVHQLCPLILILTTEEYQHLPQAKLAQAHQIILHPLRALDLLAGVQAAEHRFMREKELNERIQKLEQELNTRKLIYQAQLRLIQELGYSEDSAYAALRNESMNTRKSMAATARDVIRGVWLPARFSDSD